MFGDVFVNISVCVLSGRTLILTDHCCIVFLFLFVCYQVELCS